MKHIRQFVFAALMLLVMTPVWSQTFEVDGIRYRVTSSVEPYEVAVTRGGEYSGDIVIPEAVRYEGITYSVSSIGDNAFGICTELASISIPNSVRSIGAAAFRFCSALTSIVIPDSVTSIGPSAFLRCDGLTGIVLPISLTSIGGEAFGDCSALTSIVIPDYVTSIGSSAFRGCINLASVVIGNSVISIGAHAFEDCSALTSIVIPDSVTSVENDAFSDCINLASVVIGNSVISIGYSAFRNCGSLASVDIPNSVTSIGYTAFQNCVSVSSITIGNTLASIGEGAFDECSNGLRTIVVASDNPIYDSRENCNALIETETNTLLLGCCNSLIPNSVTSIGTGAFGGCENLTSIDFPNSLISIGGGAFYGCKNLTSVDFPNSLISIGDVAFASCAGISSIDLRNSLTSVGDRAFSGCSGMTSLVIGNSLTSIGKGAFENCKGLTSIIVSSNNPRYDSRNNSNTIVETETNTLLFGCQTSTIPSSVTSIGDYAFYGSECLTSISIPNSVTSIGYAAFFCTGLTSLDISSSVISIGTAAFECPNMVSIKVDPNNPVYDSRNNCNAIIKTDSIILVQGCKNTVIPSSVSSIGPQAFQRCYGLTSIDIPSSVTRIGNGAFSFCTGLTSIIIPDRVTVIGRLAFAACTGLATIDIPNSVERLELYAFYECTGLTSVSIGRSVNYVYTPFYGCTSLRDIEMKAVTPPNLESWGIYHYDDISLHVPCGCKEAYSEAYYWRNYTNITDSVFPFDVKVQSSDDHLGLVRLVQQPNCDNNQAVVAADPIGAHPFLSWTVNGQVVSYANPYAFTVEDDIELVANFYGTGVDEETTQTITVSPNPTQNYVNIECENMRNITLCSLDGRVSRKCEVNGDTFTLDMTGLSKGIYILRIQTQNGLVVNRKIVKE